MHYVFGAKKNIKHKALDFAQLFDIFVIIFVAPHFHRRLVSKEN